jgi:hypothetical protein
MENQNNKNSKKKSEPKKQKEVEKLDVKLNISEKDKSKSKSKNKVNTETHTENKSKDENIIFIVVEKNGTLKENEIKESTICASELSKKCKFKKVDGFIKRTEWSYSSKSNETPSSSKMIIELWAKDDGVANYENKYEFPPPVDNELYFGCCALVARDTKSKYLNLKKEKWNKIYEHLFGGFESLVGNEDDDDDEEDELDSIPKSKKTSDGYLKDGFVVESGNAGDSDIEGASSEDSDESDDDSDSDDSSSISNNDDDDADCDVDEVVDDCADDGYFSKKNKSTAVKNTLSKNKQKGKSVVRDDEDEYNSGWKTDDSSELSEEEYSYSK